MRIAAWAAPAVVGPLRRALDAVAGVSLRVADSPGAITAMAASADALVIPGTVYEAALAQAVRAHGVRWIQLVSAGYERLQAIGVPPGTIVTNAGDSWSASVAEHACMLLLALARRLPDALHAQAAGTWRRELMSRVASLDGATLVVVGFGSIGREVARRAKAFGMRVVGVRRSAQPAPEADAVFTAGRIAEALAQADAIVVAVPQSEETERLFDANLFARCNRGALFVNVSRGGVVDQDALLDALREGAIGGAGLDVTTPEPLPREHALWHAPNVIVTPHLGGSGPAAYRRVAATIAENARRHLAGEPLLHRVDVPPRA
ncbi:MAG TPA: D-2-hydroxyacid dehydrogenase [Usitatibacter sp.]|nr:D-2-hydroxyacid dehydrogenase [Usitatibacter sp.]